ncbi:hypothetical protein [Butyricimonas paravirosa]
MMNVIAIRDGKTTWRMVLTKEDGKWFAERFSPVLVNDSSD